MVSPVLYEHYYDGAFLVREEVGNRSRDNGVISTAGTVDLPLDAGLVITQNVAGSLTATAGGSNHGNGTVGSLSDVLLAQPGTYTLTATAATVFNVFDPLGKELDVLNTGTAYSDEIGLTVTAGTTAFAAGDSFTIAVAAGNSQWVPYTASTPAQNMGILYNRTVVPASGSKKVTVITRGAEVNQQELVWDPSILNAGGISSSAGSGNVGNGTIGSLTILSAGTLTGGVDPFVPTGTYALTALSSLEFAVADPSGEILPFANVGTAYADEIGFTITQGATLFAEGDTFAVVVTAGGQASALAALKAQGIIAR